MANLSYCLNCDEFQKTTIKGNCKVCGFDIPSVGNLRVIEEKRYENLNDEEKKELKLNTRNLIDKGLKAEVTKHEEELRKAEEAELKAREKILQEFKEKEDLIILSDDFEYLLETTTNQIEGKSIERYISVISSADNYNSVGLIGESIISPDSPYYISFRKARKNMHMRAKSLGANAIIGVHTSITGAELNLIIVTLTGTAVKVKDIN